MSSAKAITMQPSIRYWLPVLPACLPACMRACRLNCTAFPCHDVTEASNLFEKTLTKKTKRWFLVKLLHTLAGSDDVGCNDTRPILLLTDLYGHQVANKLEYSETFSKNNDLNSRLSWKEITSQSLVLFWPKLVISLFCFSILTVLVMLKTWHQKSKRQQTCEM